MEFSEFGKKMTGDAGILSLMDDLGKAQAAAGGEMIMMGGGNPGHVREFQELMQRQLLDICSTRDSFCRLIGSYAPPQGEDRFIRLLAAMLNREYGWGLGPENICLTNGSQTAFFMLFNLFGGVFDGGRKKKICLPLAPEYIGYADLGLEKDFFVSTRPKIELLDDNFFKYHIDFDRLVVGKDIGAICVSRPTNPTGNVISDTELEGLVTLAAERQVPLIVDSAYGLPFPGMVYTPARPLWNENIVLCLSLSKLGLPAVRTGIVIARPEVIRALTAMNAIMSLTPTNFGAVLAQGMLEEGKILKISKELVQPFYQGKKDNAVAAATNYCRDIPCRIHKPEGAMFLWLWFDQLPISSLELYRRLKDAGVLVVSGHYFFPGIGEDWRHRQQCLRVTYSQEDEDVNRGMEIIARVVRQAYEGR